MVRLLRKESLGDVVKLREN